MAEPRNSAFAGSSAWPLKFETSLVELAPETPWRFANVEIRPVQVRHGPQSCYGYRIAIDGKVLAYSGDTEWTDNLIELGRDADLFVSEASTYDKQVPMHLAYRQLVEKLPAIRPKRLIITHMGEEMLARRNAILHDVAEDGMTVEI